MQKAETQGTFQFMAERAEPSLYRNGQALMQRDPDGNTATVSGIELTAHVLTVENARALAAAAAPNLEKNGFERIDRPLQDAIDFTSHEDVITRYYPQCEQLVAEITGAEAFAFDHNVRSAGGKESGQRIEGGQDVQGPAHVVHGDYTLRGAPERLEQLAAPPAGNDTLKGFLEDGKTLIDPAAADRALSEGRYAIINVWRNIADEPVATHPLALCDGQTVLPEDLVVFEIHYPNRIGENYFAKFSPRHRMYYYPELTRDEALLIKQWDSAGPLAVSRGGRADGSDAAAPCTFSFHSAFDDPGTPADAPDRWSIEVRCMVLYP